MEIHHFIMCCSTTFKGKCHLLAADGKLPLRLIACTKGTFANSNITRQFRCQKSRSSFVSNAFLVSFQLCQATQSMTLQKVVVLSDLLRN